MVHPGNTPLDCAVIILAGGRSSRLGRPKQLLTYKGKTLLQHAIDEARLAEPSVIIVVTGSNSDLIVNQLQDDHLTHTYNPDWESGIASSINCGITKLLEIKPDAGALLLMVCDQPYVTGSLLRKLISTSIQANKPIVGCSYDNTLGIPALFKGSYFEELAALSGDSGAKKLLYLYQEQAVFVPFPKGGIDIDTSDDYKNLDK